MMLAGLDHIGVGCSDIERSIAFYGLLGLTDVEWEYTGALPGLRNVAGRDGVEARVVMLRNPRPGVLGLAGVKLVQVTDSPIPPMPAGMGWGEPGICEVCMHVRGQAELYRHLTKDVGVPGLMEPNDSELPPYGLRCSLSYVADPDGGKVELIEWPDLDGGWPGEPRPQGVNHVAFGVADLARAHDFWSRLDFGDKVFESDGYFEPMHPWYSGEPPRQKMMLLTNPRGGGIEPVQHIPPSADMRGDWGRLGPYEFGIGVSHLERAMGKLEASGVVFRSAPQTIELGDGATWRYVYFTDPDDLFVCLSEARF